MKASPFELASKCSQKSPKASVGNVSEDMQRSGNVHPAFAPGAQAKTQIMFAPESLVSGKTIPQSHEAAESVTAQTEPAGPTVMHLAQASNPQNQRALAFLHHTPGAGQAKLPASS